ncbi:MAG: hypothetical protein F4110_05505 [Acidimicrobiaceae bacterium]|nr:hypothetical protein [Acidimicrobiaceae bacterium]MYE97695.1 hypothetical protein [Acidimicrobiaceae bacterium]MYI53423.1 hypothetical protein [Acidimicrobiaceae bacterium]
MSLVGPQLEQCAPMARSGHRHCLTSLVMRYGVWVALLLIGACASDDPALLGDGGQVVETSAGTGSVALTEPTPPDAAPAETSAGGGSVALTEPTPPDAAPPETAPAEAPDGGRDAGNRAPSSAQAPSTTGPLSADRPESESPAHSGSAPDCAGQRAKWPAAPSSGTTPPAEPWNGPAVFDLERAVNDTTRAVELVPQPGTGRLFVVGRDGIISEARDGGLVEPAFLDIEAEVLSQADADDEDSAPPPGAGVESLSSEQGLLSLAFHPDHEANGLLYTFHTRFGDGASVVTEWRIRSGGDIDMGSARTVIVFEQDQAEPTHKGGQLRFGPDGYLYIAVGDGGASGDLYCHGRNRHTPLGAIARIDPMPSPTGPYTIPADNPYADGASGHPALWASGLRNPWRFTIDGDLLIIADVGWNDREEINSARLNTDAGIDYGWSAFEGEVCIRADYCDEPGAPPAVRYSHDEGAAVIGGHVYRGSAIPELAGRYLYADFTGGWLRSVTFGPDGRAAEHTDWTAQLSEPELLQGVYGFGVDAAGEVYVVTGWGQRAYKLVPAG